ncbi:hypothetical protein ABW19_dt0203376 [Dactylella cylindrospora]|nr:hypothetical protein ABW19_dt0203376 [Dactylella cylindrospora]
MLRSLFVALPWAVVLIIAFRFGRRLNFLKIYAHGQMRGKNQLFPDSPGLPIGVEVLAGETVISCMHICTQTPTPFRSRLNQIQTASCIGVLGLSWQVRLVAMSHQCIQ